jgi:hypothetical protein
MRKTFLLALMLLLMSLSALAQASSNQTPKAELFGGYSYLRVNPTAANSSGWEASLNYNLNHWFGLKADFDGHYCCSGQKLHDFMAGPQFSYRRDKFTLFVHGLGGASHGSATGFSDTVPVWAAGGGVDWNLRKNLAWRIAQADYFSTHFGGVFQHDFRGSSGLVWRIGGGPPPPPASCSVSAQPGEVMAGEAVSATVNAANFPAKHTLTYSYSSTGGKASGTGTSGSVDTTGMAPGSYNVSATVSDGKKATASCSGAFTIKEPPKHPPKISCSANPVTVRSGEASTISCTCSSPDGRSVSYSGWSASAGSLAPSGATATLDTAGVPSGAVNVNTTCSDDRGLSDSTTTAVNVEAPPPVPQASRLGDCDFKTARVDNKCKAVLDDVALRLQRDADAKAVIVGYSGPKEGKAIAAQRATNAKTYLTKEKGIDPGRISVMTGTDGGKKAEFYLVPAGATFSMPGTEMVMEKTKAPMKKAAKKKTGQ